MATVHMLYGYLGAGKTTYAKRLEREGAMRFSPDEELVARYGPTPPADEYGRLEDSIKAEIWVKALVAVAKERDVVLDFGFWRRRERDEARARIAGMGAKARLVRVACDDAVERSRVAARNGLPGELTIDDAAFEALKARFEPLGADEPHETVIG